MTVGAPEGRPAHQQFVKDRAQRVDVGRRTDLSRPPFGLLRRHVGGRAQDQIAPGQPRLAVEHLGQAEVGDPGRVVAGQKDVGRFQVAMHDPQAVGLGDGAGQLLEQPGGPPRRPGCAVEPMAQTAAGEVFELEEGQAVGLSDMVYLNDVRMLNPGKCLGLGQESCGRLGRRVRAGQDHLQGAGSIQPDLARPVDDTHAAPAQLAEDLIAGNRWNAPSGRFAVGADRSGDRAG